MLHRSDNQEDHRQDARDAKLSAQASTVFAGACLALGFALNALALDDGVVKAPVPSTPTATEKIVNRQISGSLSTVFYLGAVMFSAGGLYQRRRARKMENNL